MMSVEILAYYERDLEIHNKNLSVDKIPDFCPLCHRDIKPLYRYAWETDEILTDQRLYVIFLCPNEDCQNLYISYYRTPGTSEMYKLTIAYYYIGSAPGGIRKRDFPEEITELSKKFSEIYNQAKEAEERELREICGVGYRRALEFLIKEYLINKKVATRETIEKIRLGDCIENYIEDKRIKTCAKRAAWLGNDETHYIRKWKDKDLEDLKTLIQLTVNWIHSDLLTTKYEKEMPDKKGKTKKK